jgi:hypothetical protein
VTRETFHENHIIRNRERARGEGCDALELDAGVQRKDAHRLYELPVRPPITSRNAQSSSATTA